MDINEEIIPAVISTADSRESSPEVHDQEFQHSMESLIASDSSAELILAEEDDESSQQVTGEQLSHHDGATDEEVVAMNGAHHNEASGGGTQQPDEKQEGDSAKTRKKRRLGSRRERKISITSSSAQMDTIKEGYLTQQGRLQRWVKKYISILADHLFISKNKEDKLREEIFLKDVTVAENSTKNVNHSFTVLTPFQHVCFAAGSRKEMEEWMGAFKVAASKSKQTAVTEALQHLEGHHSWFACSHSRPTYCNVCREALHGVAWHGLSCEVCKFKSHRRCVFQVKTACKWTTRSSLQRDNVQLGQDFSIPHQWIEGNLATGSKCVVCERACGSVRRLQDFRCLWCKWTIHSECLDKAEKVCSLGEHCLSVLPPSALQRSDAIRKGMWEPYKVYGHSPILACVNSKSGDNQGVKFLRRLKYWLNPAQVFDLAISGPDIGVQLFQRFEKFRVLVLGGDGSIGWVLSTIDKYNLHSKCMVGVVPLGTGNDMARVLGWGAQFHDEEKLPQILSEMEQSSFKLLDRWSVQYTPDQNIDIQHMLKASSPTKCPSSSAAVSSSTKSIDTDTRTQYVAPFPGPGTGMRHRVMSPADSVYSQKDSSLCSEGRSPSPNSPGKQGKIIVEVDVEPTNNDHQNGEQMNGNVRWNGSGEPGVTEHSSISSQERMKAFHQSVSSLGDHFSATLLSEDGEKVASSAQVLAQLVKDFIASLVADLQNRLHSSNSVISDLQCDQVTPDLQHNPMLQRCLVLQEKLDGLVKNLQQVEEMTSDDVSKDHERKFKQRNVLMSCTNSLNKALRGVVDATEKAIDAHQSEGEVLDSEEHSSCSPPHSKKEESARNMALLLQRESASSLASVVTPTLLFPEMKELSCMNNYFGIGLDAQIAYQFNTTRDKNPAQYKSRTKNKLLFGYLGGKEFFTNTQRYLERRVQLECDGEVVKLPQRLQGLVFLNIPSYMAGTNFWGTEREKQGFSAPSHDDKLMEVVGVTGFTHLATTRVLGIQNQRLSQCRIAKLTMHGPDVLPMQVDGEAWLQEAGTIIVSHKNKARMLVKDKAFSQSLESWKQKTVVSGQHSSSTSQLSQMTTLSLYDVFTVEDLSVYKTIAASVKTLVASIKQESLTNPDIQRDLIPYVSTVTSSLERLFPDGDVSRSADVEHLQDFLKNVRALQQETLMFMHKISCDQTEPIRQAMENVETQMKMMLKIDFSACSQAQYGFRRASDTLLMVRPAQKGGKHSPSLTPHRERATLLVPDATMQAASVAKAIGKEVKSWDNDDVCQWLEAIGLSELVDIFQENEINGKELLLLQKSDIQGNLGVTKVGHVTRLYRALQALSGEGGNPILSRGSRMRETIK